MVSQCMILRAKEIIKRFGDFIALKNISFELQRGEAVAILGPSGAGKTVLLKCLAGLESITEGRVEYMPIGQEKFITVNGDSTFAEKTFGSISMVFQDIHLWPHMTVLGNIIEAPVKAKGISKKKAIEKAKEICARIGILDQLNKYPRELSLGQQQRVGIARTLGVDPDVILFDEITSALDPERTQEIAGIITDLAQSEITMLLVSHDILLTKRIAHRYLFIFDGALVCDCNSIDITSHSSLPERVERFLRATNL